MFETGLEPSVLSILVLVAFVAGIGITTIGPGGIFVTIALYSFTTLPAAVVAGTAHLMFIATGLVGSAAYTRSGEMNTGETRAIAILLSATSVAGAFTGAYVNPFVSRPLFGALLGVVAVLTGIFILVREHRGIESGYALDVRSKEGRVLLGVLGFILGVVSGLLGIGGPVLAVPALVLLGVPMLVAVAAAQVQSIFIAGFATSGYLLQDSVSVPLAIVVGVPLLVGVLVGWNLAHRIPPIWLRGVLGVVLIAVGIPLIVPP